MLKYPCLVLDHDDTVVQSEATVNYPCFCEELDAIRPGTAMTLEEYTDGCCRLGFVEMCRQWFHFTDEELESEYAMWLTYVRSHSALPYPGIGQIIRKQKENGGLICVVSHSDREIISRDYENYFGLQPDDIFDWNLPEGKRKPAPYSLNEIMRKYGLQPQELLVIDDMQPGCDMAHSVGAPAAFAGWGRKDFRQMSEHMKSICEYSFDTVSALEDFLFCK